VLISLAGDDHAVLLNSQYMDRVEEIEAAITSLPPNEYRRLLDWIRVREQATWDEQMDRDSASGKLDFLFGEAQDEFASGLVRNWPPPAK
jgi:hypothetical protein